MTLQEEHWDSQEACIHEAEQRGLTPRMGYHAWVAGQAASGYDSVIAFFEDVEECMKNKE